MNECYNTILTDLYSIIDFLATGICVGEIPRLVCRKNSTQQLTFTRGSAPYCGGACQWQKHFSTSSICDLKWFGTVKTWLLPRGWADGYSWTSGGQNSYFMGTFERPRTVGRCLLSRNIIKSFTIHPKPSHFQILRWLPDTSMKQEPIRQTDRGKLLSMKKHL